MIKKYLGKLYRKFNVFNKTRKFKNEFSKNRKNILLFGSPRHSNMGDQAQTYCILEWFKVNYPEYQVFVFTLQDCNEVLYKCIRKIVTPCDKFFIHSGYHLTDLYSEQDVYCKIAQLFQDFPIYTFPQTINYYDKKVETRTAEIFNEHGNITLLCRDEKSFFDAKKLFHNCKLLLYPDIVTSLIGSKSFQNTRDGVLLCMRNDKEAFYSQDSIRELKKRLEVYGVVKQTDTTLASTYKKIACSREKILNEIFEEYSNYRLIITDRYHGTIFSLVANTPVIVLSSTDHKLISGVKWFPKSFDSHVFFAENLNKAFSLAETILKKSETPKNLSNYFQKNYYDQLKSKY